jgi:hypothetical protein
MKKSTNSIRAIYIVAFIFLSTYIGAQPWLRGLNPGAPNNFGTNNLFPISIFTNNLQRGIVDVNGNWGFGNNLAAFAPTAQLHSHQTNANALNFFRFTNGTTGSSNLDGFMLGISNAGFAPC